MTAADDAIRGGIHYCASYERTIMYRCPKCKSDRLEVVVTVWARLTQDLNGDIGTCISEARDDSQDWGENSPMRCRDCGHSGKAGSFDESAEPMVMFRCKLCKDLVKAADRLSHLISHSPAYGSADTPEATASMFVEVDMEGEPCDECGEVIPFIVESESTINTSHATSCSLHPDNSIT